MFLGARCRVQFRFRGLGLAGGAEMHQKDQPVFQQQPKVILEHASERSKGQLFHVGQQQKFPNRKKSSCHLHRYYDRTHTSFFNSVRMHAIIRDNFRGQTGSMDSRQTQTEKIGFV